MSVTLTQNRATYSIARTLADYDVHHSSQIEDTHEELNERPQPEGAGNNPARWEEGFRRVPEYRPIDHTLDFALRDTYNNNIERVVLWNMFTGIRIVTVSLLITTGILRGSDLYLQAVNRLWRSTGGKIHDSYFRWRLGGEY